MSTPHLRFLLEGLVVVALGWEIQSLVPEMWVRRVSNFSCGTGTERRKISKREVQV